MREKEIMADPSMVSRPVSARRATAGAAGYNRRAMRYLLAAGIGVVTGIATAILWILVRFVLPIALPFLVSRTAQTGSGGVGAAGAMIGTASILLAALLGFVGGILWTLGRR
jgi:hypothetical protein